MSLHAPRVLLVEDDDLQRFTTSALLEDRGYTVRAACSLAEARVALEAPPYDLVLLDLNLGDGSGAELLEPLRDEHPRTLVALLCGEPAEAPAPLVDLILTKGSDAEGMLDRLDALLVRLTASAA